MYGSDDVCGTALCLVQMSAYTVPFNLRPIVLGGSSEKTAILASDNVVSRVNIRASQYYKLRHLAVPDNYVRLRQ